MHAHQQNDSSQFWTFVLFFVLICDKNNGWEYTMNTYSILPIPPNPHPTPVGSINCPVGDIVEIYSIYRLLYLVWQLQSIHKLICGNVVHTTFLLATRIALLAQYVNEITTFIPLRVLYL